MKRLNALDQEIAAQLEMAEKHGHDLGKSVEGLSEGVSTCAHEIRRSAENLLRETRERFSLEGQMKSRPIIILGSMIGIGFLIGKGLRAMTALEKAEKHQTPDQSKAPNALFDVMTGLLVTMGTRAAAQFIQSRVPAPLSPLLFAAGRHFGPRKDPLESRTPRNHKGELEAVLQ